MKQTVRSFASDNNAPVHESVMRSMMDVNHGDVISYGDDIHTLNAEQKFKELFGKEIVVFFVITGTGANVSSIAHITRPYNSIICSDKAHLENDECGAPEKITGCKLLRIPSEDGKIRVEQMRPLMHSVGFQHHSQPKVISITQATELGTVYKPSEIRDIARFADEHELYLHMDGARLANAAVSLDVSLSEITKFAGVDVLSFGGTKNGAMAAEALVFFNTDLAREYEYTRKQNMQLVSKMRYVSAQFSALLSNDLWLRNARQANKMAALLASKVREIKEVKITQEVQTNAVFAAIPPEVIEKLRQKYFFYTWAESKCEVRWMTAFNTTEEDVENFTEALRNSIYPGS